VHEREISVELPFVKAYSGHIMRRALSAGKNRRRLRVKLLLISNWNIFSSSSRCWSH